MSWAIRNKRKGGDVLIVRQGGEVPFDFRLMKQIRTLHRERVSVRVLFFHFQGKRTASYKLWDVVSITSANLFVRKVFPPGRAFALKQLEQTLRILIFVLLHRPNVVCLHNDVFASAVPMLWVCKRLGFIDRLVWDLRELPSLFLNTALRAWSFRLLASMCDGVACCNRERLDYLAKSCEIKELHGWVVIDNFPDRRFATAQAGRLPDGVLSWLDGSVFIYAQSVREPDRFLINFVDAIMRVEGVKAIVTGITPEADFTLLEERFGTRFTSQVLFVGEVPTLSLVDYLDASIGSVVLYEAGSPNRLYCAANRLYQSLCRGVPVVVGMNPTMANVVRECKCGVVLSSDGSDVQDLETSLLQLIAKSELYRNAAVQGRDRFIWEHQASDVLSFFCGGRESDSVS